MRLAYVALLLAAASPVQAATSAGLTRDDWGVIRRSIETFGHEAQLFGSGDPIGQQGAEFGISVAVSGDTLVVGADAHDTPAGVDTGAAYVFVRSGTTWTLQQQLVASDAAASDLFGSAVAISGDTIVVGTPFDDTPGGTDAGSAYVFVRSGTTWTEQQKLLASDGAPNDLFGSAVSISADTVLVGAFAHDAPGGVNSGTAYAFVRSGATWSQEQELVAPDGAVSDLFGCSVAVSGDTAVAGACADDTAGGADAGSAYVFVRSGTTWTVQQKLLAADGAAADAFGCSVAVSGDTAVVGACAGEGPVGGADTGSVYVFVRAGVTWTQQQELSAPDVGSNASFGYSTSISGDTVVVGARYADTAAGLNAGSAYVFVRSGTTWTQQQRLLASDAAAGDLFGSSVSISGDTVVVGASSADTPGGFGFDTGAAYVFARAGTTWTQQQKLRPPDSPAQDFFGYSASLSGESLVVGAWGDDTLGAVDSGAAYVFVRNGTVWSLQQKFRPYDPTTDARFGLSVSISGETLVVGAPGAGAGAAYVFRRSVTTWVQQQKIVAPAGALQFGQSVAISGDTLVVGAPLAGAGAAGAAYVFVRTGTAWSAQQTLVASDAAAGDAFGSSVSVSANTVVVGAPGDDIGVADTGSVYAFVRSGTTWTQQQKLLSDGAAGDALGSSVSVSGNTAVGGAPGNDAPGGTHAGAAYVFVRSGTAWTLQQTLSASDGAPDDNLGGSASISGDTLAVGAAHDDTPGGVDAGSAYVFVRSGTTWTEQQPKLVAPDGTADDAFGTAVSVSGNTVAIGAPQADGPQGAVSAGSAHVFRDSTPVADLAVVKTDGLTVAVPGQSVTYTITASNAGPDTAHGAVLLDTLPPELVGATWTCSASAGSTCTAGGSGSIDDVFNLLVGGTLTYTVTGTVDPAATGFLINTATVAGVTDPNPADNSATDGEPLEPQADLGVTKTDSADPVSPNDPLSYTVTLTNAGPSDATAVTLTDALPAGVTFVSSSPGPPTCTLAGATVTCNLGVLAAGGTGTVTINVTVNAGAAGILVNTATVAGGEPDPNASNNSGSAATAVGRREGELTHGMEAVFDLAADPGPVADEDVFRINQKPYSSYEVVVDATSGDIGAGSGPLLQRIGPDGSTVLQDSVAVGTGPSRSLRFRNSTANEVEGEAVRIRSAGCGTDCGPDDIYRIRVYETTYAVPRFNNAGTQITVLVLQNPTSYTISGEAYFRVSSGALVAVHPFILSPKAALVLNTSSLPGASGVSGTITVAHNGGYASLVGKTVALEPSTGFSFDSPLEPRPK
jgi:uncharacterized repeat protein (TIGR01451 family)